MTARRCTLGVLLAFAFAAIGIGCAVNPATGRLQWRVMSERDEVALGGGLDRKVVAQMGVYPDNALHGYVEALGRRIVGGSERPGLPWTFRVVDDAAVNAFALPGGFVYVTRGLLAHLDSEAELAAVLSHEIAHVTARHGIDQLRRARAAERRTFVFRVLDPHNRHVGAVASGTAGMVLLRHSREHEHEADDLSLRYLARSGHDPRGLVDVFGVLSGLGESPGGEEVPAWLSTHPDPKHRRDRVAGKIGARVDEGVAPQGDYLRRLDGLVFGPDPRHGFFAGATFVHPHLRFRIDLPARWKAMHTRDSVAASSEGDAVVVFIGLAETESAESADARFFEDPQVQRGKRWHGDIAGLPVIASGFTLPASDGGLAGLVNFLEHAGHVFVMVALGPAQTWERQIPAVAHCFGSFRALTDRRLLRIEPMRIHLTELDAASTLEEFSRDRPSVVGVATLALLNQVAPDERLARGRLLKRVIGFNPRRAAGSLRIAPVGAPVNRGPKTGSDSPGADPGFP